EPGYRRPWVVIQNDRTNESRLRTAIACPITSTLRLADAPGNVLLAEGEGGLKKPSVVNVSKVTAFDLGRFSEPIGKLSQHRVSQIIRGLNLLLSPAAP
ncbi:MAG TPA: type II toxin-antitoxin system PemK/MazF family toxin, partial [Tepidiformaceae bacterium]|nr:type II toxin-antitoxin system PemK/MazF family toxin [Tepidiformaceae bacterium]